MGGVGRGWTSGWHCHSAREGAGLAVAKGERTSLRVAVQHATLSVGGVALACVPGGVALGIPAGLRGGGSHGDYLECEDITTPATCRTFDADGHPLAAPQAWPPLVAALSARLA